MGILPASPFLVRAIKLLSCLLIAGALGLAAAAASGQLPQTAVVQRCFWIGCAILFFHTLEGVAAAVLAHRLTENPLRAALYTFWTGAAGLSEILKRAQAAE